MMSIKTQFRRSLVFTRRHLVRNIIWRRRLAITAGAVLLGLAGLLFADGADLASQIFRGFAMRYPYAPLLVTPLGYAVLAWAMMKLGGEVKSSGIPQTIAATETPKHAMEKLVSLKVMISKPLATCGALLVGASVGREGPTVQVSAAIMAYMHKLLRVPIRSSVIIGGGAAGVAAAFNTPLAGVAFAIEELASAYEQRMTLLVMSAVLISGMVTLGIAGDYVYFGVVHASLPLKSVLVIAPLAGLFGGAMGGLFSRIMLALLVGNSRIAKIVKTRPVLWALGCGVIVAIIGVLVPACWGTSYAAARVLIEGGEIHLQFGPAKFLASLATGVSGLPGGIFAPSLATGAGLGAWLSELFPSQPAGAIALLGMIAYFTGVVRAPLTAVVIVTEITGSRDMLIPLFAAAIIADGTARLVCREKLYHGLARPMMPASSAHA